MKNLKDLKEEILNNDIKKFYVFYGEDFGLRKHYIDQIAKKFNKVVILPSLVDFAIAKTGSGLFKTKVLYVAPNDIDFAKLKVKNINNLITNLTNDCIILDYEEELPTTTLFKEFSDNITYFPEVENNIAYQFVDSELKLNMESKEELARNCCNNYSKILLESDKIRCYASEKGISHQAAYDDLYAQNQLLYEYPEFHSYELMNDVLKGNFQMLSFWYNLVKANFLEQFWIALESIFNDYIIAYFIVKYGKYRGSTLAYEYKFNWGRIKIVRDFIIPYKAEDLLYLANQVAKLDKLVKNGKINKEDLFDYFLCIII